MRPLLPLLLLVGTVTAEDTLPLLTFSYDGGSLPTDAAASWATACQDAAAWWKTQGVTGGPWSGPMQATGWLHLRDGNLAPQGFISGWATVPGAEVHLTWPGTTVNRTDRRLELRSLGASLPSGALEPGLRVTYEGQALAKGFAANVHPAHRPLRQLLLAPLQDLRLVGRISEAEQSVVLSSPDHVLATLDAAALAQVPPDAEVTVALGLGSASTSWSPGTCTWSWTRKEHQWVASVQDGPQTRERLATLVTALPAEGKAIYLNDLAIWVRTQGGRWWISSYDYQPATHPVAWDLPAGSQGLVQIEAPAMAALGTLGRWPWTTLPTTATARSCTITVDGTGTLQTRAADLSLPWWSAAIAGGWLADTVADRVGCQRVVTTLQDLTRRGIATTVGEYRRSFPKIPPEANDLHRFLAEEASNARYQVPKCDPSLSERWYEEGLPVRSLEAMHLKQVRTLIENLDGFLGTDPKVLSAQAWTTVGDKGNPCEVLLPHTELLRNAVSAGQILVAAGDATGMTVIERACKASSQPRTLIEQLVLVSMQAMRDSSLMAMAVQGMPLPAGVLDEAPLDAATLGEVWRGELLITCWMARNLVMESPAFTAWAGPQAPPEDMNRWLTSRALAHPAVHAAMAADVATYLSKLANAVEHPLEVPTLAGLSQDNLAMAPALDAMSDTWMQRRLQHQLIRLALRCWQIPSGADFPEDTAAMARRLGRPLAVSIQGESIPCTWRVMPSGARILAMDLTGPRPPAINERLWQKLKKQPAPTSARRFEVKLTAVQAYVPRPAPASKF